MIIAEYTFGSVTCRIDSPVSLDCTDGKKCEPEEIKASDQPT